MGCSSNRILRAVYQGKELSKDFARSNTVKAAFIYMRCRGESVLLKKDAQHQESLRIQSYHTIVLSVEWREIMLSISWQCHSGQLGSADGVGMRQ